MELPNRPSAVFACNDFVGHGVIKASTDRGLLVPQQMSVIGFDNNYFDEFTDPPLTSVDQSVDARGRKAAEMIISYIETRKMPESVVLNACLVQRSSVYDFRERGN